MGKPLAGEGKFLFLCRGDLGDIAARLTESCRQVDPASTDKALEEVEQETE